MPVLTHRPRAVTRSRGELAGLAVIGLAALGVFLGSVSGVLDPPPQLDGVKVVNDQPWNAVVEARPEGRGGWSSVVTADAGTTAEVDRVLDQGRRWELRFRYGGRIEVTEVRTRAELEASDWTITVPDAFGAAGRAEGLVPSPGG
jgi:hypothetical protein